MRAEIIFWSYFSFWYSQNRSRISGPSGCCEVANLLVYLSPFASSSAHPHWHCWGHVDCIYNLHGHMLPPHFLILFMEWKFYGKHFATGLWTHLERSTSHIMTALSLSSPHALASLFEVPSLASGHTHPCLLLSLMKTTAAAPVYVCMVAHLIK